MACVELAWWLPVADVYLVSLLSPDFPRLHALYCVDTDTNTNTLASLRSTRSCTESFPPQATQSSLDETTRTRKKKGLVRSKGGINVHGTLQALGFNKCIEKCASKRKEKTIAA
ncbi:predicted protein [Plenodomus lingam JN3]|uniref:Predicted protein n=1 Tax=Leptosphaeria maculans (strain JN3 / isolate v23.1.3 / race Av1-4-5-6-7-8) TaxID=985895 RepID=E5R4Q3_LEPMJ|nr:predicted protein [Plenodomus lingam JN3]CBX92176.1 predicted protein [Plenodomus lingam JN3]